MTYICPECEFEYLGNFEKCPNCGWEELRNSDEGSKEWYIIKEKQQV